MEFKPNLIELIMKCVIDFSEWNPKEPHCAKSRVETRGSFFPLTSSYYAPRDWFDYWISLLVSSKYVGLRLVEEPLLLIIFCLLMTVLYFVRRMWVPPKKFNKCWKYMKKHLNSTLTWTKQQWCLVRTPRPELEKNWYLFGLMTYSNNTRNTSVCHPWLENPKGMPSQKLKIRFDKNYKLEKRNFYLGGKEILLKAVAISTPPTYAMSCFKLLKNFCSKLESFMAHFWWVQKDNERRIY